MTRPRPTTQDASSASKDLIYLRPEDQAQLTRKPARGPEETPRLDWRSTSGLKLILLCPFVIGTAITLASAISGMFPRGYDPYFGLWGTFEAGLTLAFVVAMPTGFLHLIAVAILNRRLPLYSTRAIIILSLVAMPLGASLLALSFAIAGARFNAAWLLLAPLLGMTLIHACAMRHTRQPRGRRE